MIAAVVAGDHHRAGKFFGRNAAFDDPIDLSKLSVLRLAMCVPQEDDEQNNQQDRAAPLPGRILLIAHPRAKVSSEPISTNHVHAILGKRNGTVPSISATHEVVSRAIYWPPGRQPSRSWRLLRLRFW